MPLGRETVKLQWQVATLGTPFTSTNVISGTSAEWIDTGTSGVVITQNVTGLAQRTAYHWRVRLLYRPGNRLGQSASRWVHVPWNGWGEEDFRTPAEVVYASTVITYTYDALNRLTQAEYSDGTSYEYEYDAVGNRTMMTSTTSLSGTVVTTFTYDTANRLADRVVSDGRTYTYTWSARGQMLAEWIEGVAVRTFAYDGAGQMVEATVFTLTTQFVYNGLGGRVAISVEGRGVITYTLDHANGMRVLAERTVTGTMLYLYGRDCLGQFDDTENEWLYYLNDAKGFVRQGTNEQGEVVSAWQFDPDGLVTEGPEGRVSHLVCGGIYDWSTGLIYKGGRYFDPMLGIWLALMSLMVVQSWKGRKKRRRGFPWYVLVLCLVGVGGTLTACDMGTVPIEETAVCTEVPPLATPTPTIFESSHYVKGLTPEKAEGYYQYQTTNDCGPYSTAIAVNIYKGYNAGSSDYWLGARVVEETEELERRTPGTYTKPEVIVSYLAKKGIPARVRRGASKKDLLASLDNGYVPMVLDQPPQIIPRYDHWSVLCAYEPAHLTTFLIGGKEKTEITPWGFVDPGQPHIFFTWVTEERLDEGWEGTYVEVGVD